MSVLIDLPEDLFIEILQEWLPAEEIGFLDSACCNKVLRRQLLKQLKVISVSCLIQPYVYFYDWIYLRELKLNYLWLHDSCFNLSDLKFKVRFNEIQKINIVCPSACIVAISTVLNSCQNLTALNIDDCSDNWAILENCSILRQINNLTYSCNDYNHGKAVKIIAEQCTQLKTYVFKRNSHNSNYEPLYKQLFLNNPMLTVIETNCTLSVTMLRECCPNIETLNVNIDRIDAAEILALLTVVKQLNVQLGNLSQRIFYDKKGNILRLVNHCVGTVPCTTFDQIVKGIHGVKTMELNALVELSEESVDHLSSTLERVEFWHTNGNIVELMLTKCKLLHTMYVNSPHTVLGSNLAQILSSIKPTALQTLMTTHDLAAADCMTIIQSCGNLQSFTLKSHRYFSPAAINAYKVELCNPDKPINITFSIEPNVLKIVKGCNY